MDRKINFDFKDMTGKTFHFETLNQLHSFLKGEVDFWQKQKNSIVNQSKFHIILKSHGLLQTAIETIESWPQNQIDTWEDQQLQKKVNQMVPQIFDQTPGKWLWSGHPFVETYINCHKNYDNDAAEAFLKYVVNNQIVNINNPNNFTGVMLGYEFLNQDSDLVKRRNSEKSSLDHLRNQLEETNNKLIKEVAEFERDFINWDKDSRKNWVSWIEETSRAYTEQHNRFRTEHTAQQNTRQNEFNTYIDNCKNQIIELENLYREKLKLEAPAQYWNNAARKFNTQGRNWARALIFLILLGLIGFGVFYNSWLKGQAMDIQLSTVKGVILFGTIVAVFAYLIRVLSKLTFSSFHLMRDAEEREQTYLPIPIINK